MPLRDYHKRIAKAIHNDKDGSLVAMAMIPTCIGFIILTIATFVFVWNKTDLFICAFGAAFSLILAFIYGLFMLGAYFEELTDEMKKDGTL